jgi:hypothetical protein
MRPPPGSTPDPDALRESTLGSLLAAEARLSHEIFAVRSGIATEPLTAETFLETLAIRAAIARALAWGSQIDVREAIEAGATWPQIATARGTTLTQAREDFLLWIDGQAKLWDDNRAAAITFGLGPSERRAIRALAESNE